MGISNREQFLQSALAELLQIDRHELSPTTPFAELGLDSLLGLRFTREIQDHLQAEVELEWLFDNPSIRQLAEFLDGKFGVADMQSRQTA
ncbi:phosphopantetheine binding protein [Tahibacter aquaticus]|uniref:Phosphopantetheine binding protein n=1 Tax=Tahibacter aquaticus TaxID=520092 RepID=A0A4R6YRU8_9GAMM|nr:acyl carrier protein [Tahibacter aquaticus]TDR40688.1 phosphopantetheine binding protein [Tahibacter aquaticus]